MLTVKELIAQLQKMPQDMLVGSLNYYDHWGPADCVETIVAKCPIWDNPPWKNTEQVVIYFDLDVQ